MHRVFLHLARIHHLSTNEWLSLKKALLELSTIVWRDPYRVSLIYLVAGSLGLHLTTSMLASYISMSPLQPDA